MRAGLIFRPDKGKNNSRLSTYVSNIALFDYQKKTRKKKVKSNVAPDVADADARGARDSFYSRAKRLTEIEAERYASNAAEISPRWKAVCSEIRGIEVPMIRAQHNGDRKTFAALKIRHNQLCEESAALMRRFDIDEERLKASYYAQCRACFDTGVRKDGTLCDCYLRRRLR